MVERDRLLRLIVIGDPPGQRCYSLAQMERELIVERTRAGGRKRRVTDRKIKAAHRLLASGTLPRDVAENLGVSVPTLYRWLPASERP